MALTEGDGRSPAGPWALAALACAATAATLLLAARALRVWHDGPVTVDEVVELVVEAAAVIASAWLAVGAAVGLLYTAARGRGRDWRAGRAFLAGCAPRAVRRLAGIAVTASVAVGVAAPVAVAAPSRAAEPEVTGPPAVILDLGWQPTPDHPSTDHGEGGTGAGTSGGHASEVRGPADGGTGNGHDDGHRGGEGGTGARAEAWHDDRLTPATGTREGVTQESPAANGVSTKLTTDGPGTSPPAADRAATDRAAHDRTAPHQAVPHDPAPQRPGTGRARDPERTDQVDRHARRGAARDAPAPVQVREGDTLWAIATEHLRRTDPTPRADGLAHGGRPGVGRIVRAVAAWHTANLETIGPDPDLIRPGTVLRAPDEHRVGVQP